MIRKSLICAAISLVPVGALMADFSYEQTSTVTGGSMMAMMRLAGAFSRSANQPTKTSHYIKGDKMATVSANTMNIIDLGAETVTEVDLQKKTYSVMTFAQMKQMMERMGGAAQDAPTFKVSANPTGATKKINGLDAKEIVMTMEGESKDPRSGKAGTFKITTDSWMAADVPGYDEVQAFGRKMAAKMDWTPSSMGGMMNRPDLAKGMAEVVKEMAKLGGVPVLQVVKMSVGAGADMPQMTPEQQAQLAQASQQADAARQQAAQQSQSQPTQEKVTAGSVIGGALGSRIGGLGGVGGFGRKKPQPAAEPAQTAPQAAAATPAAAPAAAQAGDPSVLMETTIEASGFSGSSVDASKLEVPAGFKKVESRAAGR